jgi:hypothetical protein
MTVDRGVVMSLDVSMRGVQYGYTYKNFIRHPRIGGIKDSINGDNDRGK